MKMDQGDGMNFPGHQQAKVRRPKANDCDEHDECGYRNVKASEHGKKLKWSVGSSLSLPRVGW